jgi:hypothetical protein
MFSFVSFFFSSLLFFSYTLCSHYVLQVIHYYILHNQNFIVVIFIFHHAIFSIGIRILFTFLCLLSFL